ncbi:MAG: hypothetical protein K0S46_762 [Moraxellaceae bacterium]|jgi:uncharacterized protein YccT (UPF0319 family)|nr:hypothetical protein [Moraxellaceae bacterium]
MVRLYGIAALALAGILLTGCVSTGPIKAYEGPERPVAEVALVDAPEQIEIMAIDGREPPPGFLRSGTRLALLPGEHVFSLRYVQLFQIGADEHDVIRSRQAAMRVRVEAGQQYRLDMPRQASRDAAREFSKSPSFRLLDAQGASAAESTAVKSYAEASLIDTISKAFESQGQVPQPVTDLDLLKDIWGRTSPEQREAFRHWLGQQDK